MTMQKLAVTDSYQNILMANDSAVWIDQIPNLRFATDVDPDISGDSALLTDSLDDRLFIEAGATLYFKVDSGESELFIDDEIIA